MSSNIKDMTKSTTVLVARDFEELEAQGSSLEQVESQIQMFKQGIPFTTLSRTCRLGDRINSLSPSQMQDCGNTFDITASSGRDYEVCAGFRSCESYVQISACLPRTMQHY